MRGRRAVGGWWGTATGMRHESWHHSISPISAVPLQRAHIRVFTKNHRAVKDTHMHTKH